MNFTKLAMLILIAGMLIGVGAGGCKRRETENLTEIKARVQAETPKESEEIIKKDPLQIVKLKRLKQEEQKRVERIERELNAKLLDAYCMAQRFVEQRLKSPRSVKWPWISYKSCTTYLDNNRYRISTYCDAQNSFGALIRTHFVCIVKYIGSNDWRLESLIF